MPTISSFHKLSHRLLWFRWLELDMRLWDLICQALEIKDPLLDPAIRWSFQYSWSDSLFFAIDHDRDEIVNSMILKIREKMSAMIRDIVRDMGGKKVLYNKSNHWFKFHTKNQKQDSTIDVWLHQLVFTEEEMGAEKGALFSYYSLSFNIIYLFLSMPDVWLSY